MYTIYSIKGFKNTPEMKGRSSTSSHHMYKCTMNKSNSIRWLLNVMLLHGSGHLYKVSGYGQ